MLPTTGSDGRISRPDSGEGTGKPAKGLVKQVYAAVGNWGRESMQALGWGGRTDGGYNGRYDPDHYQ